MTVITQIPLQRTQLQRPALPMLPQTWHRSKYKVNSITKGSGSGAIQVSVISPVMGVFVCVWGGGGGGGGGGASFLQIYFRHLFCRYTLGILFADILWASFLQIYFRHLFCRYTLGIIFADVL